MLLQQLLQDVRYGVRVLRRNPAFTAVTVLTLALGTAVNTAVFSVVNAVLLQPLPYPDAGRLVAYSDNISRSAVGRFKAGIPGADFEEWRSRAHSFEGLTGYVTSEVTLSDSHDAWPLRIATIAGDFWAMTGARATVGRLFGADEAQNSIVVSHRFFEQRLGGDPRLIGQAMTLDGQATTLVGVLPPDFEFLFPRDRADLAGKAIEAYVPMPPLGRAPNQRKTLFVAAKLKPGLGVAAALAELRTLETQIQKDNPDRWFAGVATMDLLPMRGKLASSVRPALAILQVAGLFVLLIACANIANLLLARAAARQKEVAIRTAIGAGAARILRQFLAEGLVLPELCTRRASEAACRARLMSSRIE